MNETAINNSKELARSLIRTYFNTVLYPYTKHHIDSYDAFLKQDLIGIVSSNNPLLILKDLIDETTNTYRYRVEVYVGGLNGDAIQIGTPTMHLQRNIYVENGDDQKKSEPEVQFVEDVGVMYPNDARLRNLTYASTIYADIVVKITFTPDRASAPIDISPPENTFKAWPLCLMPIMLHSSYCILHDKPKAFLKQVGECPYDNGGYFIVNGAEKVLVTRQEAAFNTLYISPQNDPKVRLFASIQCISSTSRMVKRVAFTMMRQRKTLVNPLRSQDAINTHETILVSLPFVRKPIPLFVLFRALGFQSDEEILHFIFPDFDDPEARLLMPKLHASILEGYPFLSTITALNYIKTLTKGYSVDHVIDILRNQLFIHMPSESTAQAIFLGDCVRKILRVNEGYDGKTDRDDIRNQRCLTSGFLIQELFNNSYKQWCSATRLAIDKEYNYNKGVYINENFRNIFTPYNQAKIFKEGLLRDMILKGFKGKWGTGLGEEKEGVLQSLSRLSYVDFMSHCRRVILNFDTSMKLTGPRKLHTTQYGYFCTSETPTGASIGIAKNLSIMTAISTSTNPDTLIVWLYKKGGVIKPDEVTIEERAAFVPVYLNGGIIGYSDNAPILTDVLKLFKRTGCLPYSASITFSIRDRKVYIYLDAGRPLRPLIWLPSGKKDVREKYEMQRAKIEAMPSWRFLVLGNIKKVLQHNAPEQLPEDAKAYMHMQLTNTTFMDPYEEKETTTFEEYHKGLEPHTGAIEYVDPYEQNETYIANFPENIQAETTHIEVHPSTIMSMMTSMIPFAHHNQSPRNQLSCSQSKQGISVYSTNWKNRFDNSAHVLCYGEMPLVRTMYNNFLGEGNMVYGMNCILAIACWTGYNQEDGIVMNHDAIQRGMFRTIAYRSYEAFEEDDKLASMRVRFANPINVPTWTDLRPGLDYSKLDDNGIIREGEYVDENTVIVGGYMESTKDRMVKDASTTPQVWTRGRVEKVAVMLNNAGLRLVKIRVVQDRIPELGDKFCLSPDHEVRTDKGWIPITDVTLQDRVLQRNPDSSSEFVCPIDIIGLEYDSVMYEVHCASEDKPLLVSPNHRLIGMYHDGTTYCPFDEEAHLFAKRQHLQHYHINENNKLDRILFLKKIDINSANTIHCLTVPSSVFMVRRMGATHGYWTGNSNRHGQKGTIGALLRGYDMPRTESGIVPDMIMNPHAIPSRMTIAQNLEQLLGKAGLQAGAFGDGTSFMNSESPQDVIGEILEANDFERYGNETMYNGATGEQIPVSIFIGPVYGMRLKHMVEDKWQARGKGRKDSKTHQPTAGRGAQGGLKIGEMDRDAILGHATAAFFKEAFMERSDGTTMPLCVSCGMVPIYNPRIGLAVCSMCDGPLRYIGTDNVNTIELLPPLGRPKAKIVEVEIPYSTKLLVQEQEAFLNMSMRFITTNGVECLRPLERIAEEVPEDASDTLAERVLPEPEAIPEVNVEAPLQNMISLQDLNKAIENAVAAYKEAEAEIVIPEEGLSADGEPLEEMDAGPIVNISIPGPMQSMQQMQPMPQIGVEDIDSDLAAAPAALSQQPMVQQQQMMQQQMVQQPQMMQQPVAGPAMMSMPGGPMMGGVFQYVDGMPIVHSGMPIVQAGGAGHQIINIDTSTDAMQRDGIDIMGGGRPLRRRYAPQVNLQLGPSPIMAGPSSVAAPSATGSFTGGGLTVTKLE